MRIIVCVALLVGRALAQLPDSSLRFEVASIQEVPRSSVPGIGCAGGPGTPAPERLKCFLYVGAMISQAYDLNDYQLNPPDWMRNMVFKIEAVVPPRATAEQLAVMERNLLADRFHLGAHFEKQQRQIYEMKIGASGIRFHEWSDEGALTGEQQAANRNGPPMSANMRLGPGVGFNEAADMYGHHALKAKYSMRELAGLLSRELSRPVIDSTGLTGTYNIMLDWVGDPPQPRRAGARVAEPGSLAVGPGLLEVLQQQGLKLESKKGAIDVFIVDHIDRTPTEN